jgi:hypothetical protein
MVFSYAGSGSISPVVGFDFGNISYSYTPSSILPFIYVDLGTLGAPTATIDHGSVTEPTTGQEDWGDMRYDQQTRFPFGVVRLASSTTFVVKKVFVGSGQLFELGEAFTRLQAPWIVEGTISLRGEANAAFLYRYDASGIQHVYGDAAPSFTTLYEGSGSLFSTSFTGEAKATVYPEQPDTRKTLFEIGSEALVLSSLRHIGSGSLFNIGSTQPLRTFGYSGSGTLFGFGNETRSLTYAYPGTDFFTYEDYGQVAAATTQPNEDFGSLFRDPGDDVYEIFDRGEILVNYTKYPHGLFKLRSETVAAKLVHITGTGDIFVVGDARTKGPQNHYGEGTFFIEGASKETFSLQEFGSGFISTLSGAAETFTASPEEEDKLLNFRGIASQSKSATPPIEGLDVKVQGAGLTRFIPRYNGRVHLDIDGGLVTEKVTLAHLGTGVLFDFIGAEERRVYSYNTSSIDFITHPDYGLVADAATTFEDYGDLDLRYTGETGWMSTPDIRVDYHGILDNYTNYPFGLLPLKGTGETPRLRAFTGSGTLEVRGEVFIFVPPVWDGQGVITIEGSAEEAFVSREQFQTLFEFKGALENVNIGRGYQGTGIISTLSGAAEAFTGNPQEREALFSLLGEAQTRFIPRYNGSVHLDIDGGLVTEKVTLAHQTTGSLFNFVGADERRVYSYNSTSIDFFVPVDLGYVAATPSTSAEPVAVYTETDFGTLDLVYTGEEGWFSTPDDRQDWQYILDHDTTYPFGLFERFSGTATVRFEYEYVGSGSFDRLTGGVELRFPNVHSSTGGLTIFGAATSEKVGIAESFNVLFEATGFADIVTAVSLEQDVRVEITGLAGVSFTGNTVQDATIFITGASSEVRTRGYQGSGSIFSNGILSEAVTKTFPLVPGYTANLNLTATNIYNRFGTSWTGPSHSGHPEYGSTGENTVAWYPNGGSGTCQFGGLACIDGFDVGPHFRIGSGFGSNGAPRELKILLDLTNVEEITLSIIRGNGDNGGSLVDDQDHLRYRIDIPHLGHTGGSHILVNATDTSFDSLKDVTISTYPGERVNNAVLVLEQPVYLDTMVSAWGFTGLNYVVNRPGDVRKNLFDITGESVFRATKAHEGFGTLFGLSGASESKSSDEVFTTLFNITGASTEVRTRGYEGTGSIFSNGILSEAVTKTFPLTPGYTANLTLTATDLNNQTLTNITPAVEYVTGGTGTGSSGGFNIGPYFKFGVLGTGASYATDGRREVAFTLDLRQVEELTFNIIKGNGTNGGDTPECFTDSSGNPTGGDNLGYSINLTGEGYLAHACTTSLENLSAVTVPVPPVHRIANARVSVYQIQHSGSTLDAWGFQSLEYTINRSGDQRKNLFDVTGNTTFSRTRLQEGSGSLFSLSGASESATFREVFAKLRLDITGEAVVISTQSYEGTGFISTLSGAAESFTASPDDLFSLFDLTGSVSDSTTKGFVGSGTLFSFSGATESATFSEAFTTLLDFAGEAVIVSARGYAGTGVISTLSGAAEAFTASPDDLFSLFDFTGGITSVKSTVREIAEGALFDITGETVVPLLTFAEELEVQARISGAGSEAFLPNWVGRGSISTLSGAAESFTVNPRERELLFSITGSAEEAFSFGNYDADSAARIFGAIPKPPTLVFAESGFGTFTASGEGEYAHVDIYGGFGTIFAKGIGGESVTRRIPAFQADLALSGFAGKAVTFNPPDITTHLRITGEGIVPIRTFIESFTVRLTTDGTARERFVPNHIGDGAIASRGIGGEAISRRLPAFQADMFISGFAGQKTAVSEQFFGSLFTFSGSSAPELLAFAEQPEVQVEVSGESKIRFSLLHIGEGRISTLSGAAESATFNPTEREVLFSFGGGVSDIKIVKAETKQIEVSVTGEATDIRFIPNWIVEGTIPVSGIAHTTRSVVHTGEGFISTLSGAAESFTYNPTEDTALFTFLGTASIRSAVSEVKTVSASIFNEPVKVIVIKSFIGSGVVPVSGQKDERTAKVYEGTGVISTLSGSAESFTVNPDDLFTLFNVLGVADTRPIKVFTKIGSGALFTSFTAGEARAISVPVNIPSQESKGLFKLEGSSPESFTIPYEGFGSLFSFAGLDERRTFAYETEGTVTVSGIASTPRTRDYEGSGSLFSFIEAESAVRFIPSTRTVLFDITGESVFRTTQAHEGTGSLFTTFTAGESRTFKVPQHLVPNLTFLGAARIKNTYRYQGENHLEITGSAQESFTPTVYEGDVRLKTSGESAQKFVAAETSQGGTIKVRGAATFLTTNAFQTYTLFDIVGVADVTKSAAFAGSGTIFTFVSAEEIGPDRKFEAGGTITLRGESIDKKVSVAPERTYGWII